MLEKQLIDLQHEGDGVGLCRCRLARASFAESQRSLTRLKMVVDQSVQVGGTNHDGTVTYTWLAAIEAARKRVPILLSTTCDTLADESRRRYATTNGRLARHKDAKRLPHAHGVQ